METVKQIPAATENNTLDMQSPKEASVTFRCSETQKNLLIKKAVDDSGLSVSEFCKYKIFSEVIPSIEKNKEVVEDVLSDAERTALEALITKQRLQIVDLNNQIFELKAQAVNLKDDANRKPEEDAEILEVYTWVKENLFEEGEEMSIDEFKRLAVKYIKYRQETGSWSREPFTVYVNNLLRNEED
ncbi:MAG: hypothetical protein WKF91_20825 [Segetibacter sp.]